ncbi:MAG: gamma carbonic anhydrase family protein [Nitrososphaerota archaeon]|nr:gamma carbonic anhydrase family protein [Nitrososphaerota archaeon]
MHIYSFNNKKPSFANGALVHDTAVIIGDVHIGENSSVWPNAVLRGDMDSITVGKLSNLQDNVTVHTDKGIRVTVGDGVVIGHNAIIHGATISDNVLIGMGAIIMNGSKIGANSIIGAGTVIPEKKVIPEASLVVGTPGRIIRKVSEKEIENISADARNYFELAKLELSGPL